MIVYIILGNTGRGGGCIYGGMYIWEMMGGGMYNTNII